MKNKDNVNRLSNFTLVRFNRKTGRIDKTLTGIGFAMLQLWGLQNTTKTKDSILFETNTGLLITYFTGSASGMPKVDYGMDNENVEKYCPGLVEAMSR